MTLRRAGSAVLVTRSAQTRMQLILGLFVGMCDDALLKPVFFCVRLLLFYWWRWHRIAETFPNWVERVLYRTSVLAIRLVQSVCLSSKCRLTVIVDINMRIRIVTSRHKQLNCFSALYMKDLRGSNIYIFRRTTALLLCALYEMRARFEYLYHVHM